MFQRAPAALLFMLTACQTHLLTDLIAFPRQQEKFKAGAAFSQEFSSNWQCGVPFTCSGAWSATTYSRSKGCNEGKREHSIFTHNVLVNWHHVQRKPISHHRQDIPEERCYDGVISLSCSIVLDLREWKCSCWGVYQDCCTPSFRRTFQPRSHSSGRRRIGNIREETLPDKFRFREHYSLIE